MKKADELFGLKSVISKEHKDIKGKCAKFWPAHSPDFNPLDFNVWNELKRTALKLTSRGFFENRKQCKAKLIEAWAKVRPNVLWNACTFGVLNKTAQCLLVGGGSTKSYSVKKHGPLPVYYEM